jgi:hypothetical protein
MRELSFLLFFATGFGLFGAVPPEWYSTIKSDRLDYVAKSNVGDI